MKYKTEESVRLKKTKKIVKIIDCEIVEGIEIYYTSDKSAYISEDFEKIHVSSPLINFLFDANTNKKIYDYYKNMKI